MLFHPFDEAGALAIVEKQLAEVRERLCGRRTELVVSDGARRALVREGLDVRHGARGLKRLIQRKLVRPLSRLLIERRESGATELRVVFDGDGVRPTDASR